ncbi:MBL fold metallo-hydrolase [Paeniroseomonas aquatica]|uniref:MBL fold metallo-hydrolase n=1 Tax=Paeniroseomonas aquatica TaxID=373043 RepID=UPI0036157164
MLGFDRASGATDTRLADKIADNIQARRLTVEWVLDTHPHADHLSAVAYLGEQLGAPTGIGARVAAVQEIWADIYNLPGLQMEGHRYWDRLFAEGDRFRVGGLEVEVLFSPGHTAASVTYLIGDAAFVHDTVFMPDSGTARTDFPGGDARALYRSIQKILRYRRRRASSPAMTTARVGARRAGSQLWLNSGRATFTSTTTSVRRSSWAFEKSATERCPCPG